MKETDPEIVALAEAWASVDGKLHEFLSGIVNDEKGYRAGYLSEAKDLAERLKARGFHIIHKNKIK